MSFLLLTAAALVSGAIGEEMRIKSVDDFTSFMDNVNNGVNYSGTTVFLGSDIDFTGKTFKPIGYSDSKYFSGVFDGQGHVISNLKMDSSSQYVGLFALSYGLTIKNVILDSSCSITSLFISSSYDDAYVGGTIGYCRTKNGPCSVENSVNMGSVSFSGNISVSSSYLYLGWIAGQIYSSNYESTVKNCANYGDVTHFGESKYSHIGGVIGYSDGSSSNRIYIYNCLNYGTITHSGTTSSKLRLGGIAGSTDYTTVENCVNGGKISTPTATPKYNYVESIIGYVYSDTSINYCYYTGDLSDYTKRSGSFSYDNTTFELNGTVSIGTYTGNSLIDALNTAADYYSLRDYSNWLLNKNKKTVTFTINGRTNPIKMDYQILLLPSLASEGKLWFNGWYTDSGVITPLTSYEISSGTKLFGSFKENINNYTITFDTRGGSSVPSITAPFCSVVTIPSDSIREHCTFSWWENVYGDKVESFFTTSAHNITLYVVWKCTRIETPDDFIGFSKVVNSGTNYEGTTVFFDSDIDISGKTFEPIGTYSKYFRGIFDGQGHAISNLEMNSSSRYAGLFGFSTGLTIKNVILDSSCSITSSYIGSGYAYIGGIVGECDSDKGPCIIENSVNMGSVTFSGSISSYSLNFGGIAGKVSSSNHESTVKNCANYGDATHSGTSRDSHIGGVIGYSDGSSSNRIHIYNSLNHGTITHSGTTSYSLYLGGFAGYTYYTTIENCVSGGKVSSLTKQNNVGSIIGYAYSGTIINYYYFTSDLNGYNKCGQTDSTSIEFNILNYDNTTFHLNGTVSIENYTSNSLIDALNAAAGYYTHRDYSHWLLNKGNNSMRFTVNGRSTFTMNYQIILLPSLANEGNMSFDGWYTDNGLTTPLSASEITISTDLYGRFEENTNNYTISFDTRGGPPVSSITAPFNSVVTLPSNLIDGKYIIAFWETLYGDKIEFNLTMQAHNITLYAAWKCTRIETTEDFIDFSNTVNNGARYYDVTVFLDSDLDLTGKTLKQIGGYYNYFRGVFDGQGHVISNITATTSSQYVGLFGYSGGLTIKNVILDSSCSITSSYRGSYDPYVGGIIGQCYANDGPCTIENSVNMGSASFSGYISGSSLYIGGIVGGLYSYNYKSIVKNCANYGDAACSKESYHSNIGGIVGYSRGGPSNTMCIYNCLNHGTISHSGTTSYELYLGGIAGSSYYTTVENCVSGGKITTLTTAPRSSYIGSIVGGVYSDTTINYCYFTNELNDYTKRSGSFGYDNTTFELSGTVSIGSYTGISLVDALNAGADYYALRDYSRWVLNKDKKTVSFTINGRTNPIKIDSQIILLPSLVSEGNINFDGWYTNKELTKPFTETTVSENIKLFGKYCGPNFTATLDVNGGDELIEKEITIYCENVYGDLPTAMRTGYTFVGWFTGKIGGTNTTAEDIVKLTKNTTLYAHWTANKYTVTFDVNGGNPLSESESKKEVTYDNTYGDLPEATRTEYSFIGWFTEKNESITEESIVSISDNHTLCARWLEVSSQVEIVFSKKSMTQDEIERVIKQYINTEFEIVEVESGEDEMRVIIKFIDSEKAEEFFRNVKDAPGRGERDFIKRIGFVLENTRSFSIVYHPMMPLLYLI